MSECHNAAEGYVRIWVCYKNKNYGVRKKASNFVNGCHCYSEFYEQITNVN